MSRRRSEISFFSLLNPENLGKFRTLFSRFGTSLLAEFSFLPLLVNKKLYQQCTPIFFLIPNISFNENSTFISKENILTHSISATLIVQCVYNLEDQDTDRWNLKSSLSHKVALLKNRNKRYLRRQAIQMTYALKGFFTQTPTFHILNANRESFFRFCA